MFEGYLLIKYSFAFFAFFAKNWIFFSLFREKWKVQRNGKYSTSTQCVLFILVRRLKNLVLAGIWRSYIKGNSLISFDIAAPNSCEHQILEPIENTLCGTISPQLPRPWLTWPLQSLDLIKIPNTGGPRIGRKNGRQKTPSYVKPYYSL